MNDRLGVAPSEKSPPLSSLSSPPTVAEGVPNARGTLGYFQARRHLWEARPIPERVVAADAAMRSPHDQSTPSSWGGSGSWGNPAPSPRRGGDAGNVSGRHGAAALSAPSSRGQISELGRTSLLNRRDSNDGYGGRRGDDDEHSEDSSYSSLTSDEPWSAVFMQPTTTTTNSSIRMIGGSGGGAFDSVSPSSISRDEKKVDDNISGGIPRFLRRGAAFRESKALQFHQGRHQPSQHLHDGGRALAVPPERESNLGPAFVPYLDGGDVIPTSRRGGSGDHNSKGLGTRGTRGSTGRKPAGTAADTADTATATTLSSGAYPHPPPFGSVVCFLVFSSCPQDRLVVELFQEEVPAAANVFQELCCLQNPRKKGQVGSIVQRIVPNSYVQIGDSSMGNGAGRATTEGAGMAGESVHKQDVTPGGPLFQHSEPGLLSIAVPGPDAASAPASHFFITVRPMPHLDGRHIVFGRVLIGMDSVVRHLTHNTALDDRQRPMFDRISIVDSGHIIHGKEVRLEEPSPAGRHPMNTSPESALQIDTNRPNSSVNDAVAAPSDADVAAPPSVFAFTALKAAALAVVSCDAFSPFASIAANDPTDEFGANSILLSTRTPKTSTLFDSLSTESEAETESLAVAGSENAKPVPATVPAAPTTQLPPVDAINTAASPVSPTETTPNAPTIPFSFSTFSATSTLTDVSAFLRSPFKAPTSPPLGGEGGHDTNSAGARSPSNDRPPPNGSPEAAVVDRDASRPDDRDPPDDAVPPASPAPCPMTKAERSQPALHQLEQVPHGIVLITNAPASAANDFTEEAARTGSSSSHGSKLEPPGIVFEEEASAFCAVPGPVGKGTGLETTGPGADTIASSDSLKDFLTTSEDAVAEFLFPAAESQGSDGLREDAMDSPNNHALENVLLSIGSSDSDVEHKALPGVSLTTRNAVQTSLGDEETLENAEPPNLYSISYSTVASGSLLAGGSPSAHGPDTRRGPGRGSRTSCTDSMDDDDEDDSLLQPSGTFESTLDAASSSRSSVTSPTSSESAPYTFISSSNPFGWAAAAAVRGGQCGSDSTVTAVRRLVATDPPPAGGLVARRLVPARIGTETSTMTMTRSATPRWATSASSSVRSSSATSSLRSALRPARYTPTPSSAASVHSSSSLLAAPPSTSPPPIQERPHKESRHRQGTRRVGAAPVATSPIAAAPSPVTTTTSRTTSTRTHSPLMMSSILTDPLASLELEALEDDSQMYVPAELRHLVAEVAATLDEAQQSFLSSAHETTEEEEDAVTATTTTTAGEAST